MAIQETKSLLHWNYFLALESDVERLARYVEFTNQNFGTYSIEIAHLFLAASSEVDVVAKQLCSRMDPATTATNIFQYRELLRRCLPELENSIVAIPRYGLDLRPWSNWLGDNNPDWWQAYNDVKHHRDEHFAQANLKNVLNAMASLFLVILYYYRDNTEYNRLEPIPSIFVPSRELAYICPISGGPMALVYNNKRR